MKLWVVAVGQRTPDWAQVAWDDYAKRFPPSGNWDSRPSRLNPEGASQR